MQTPKSKPREAQTPSRFSSLKKRLSIRRRGSVPSALKLGREKPFKASEFKLKKIVQVGIQGEVWKAKCRGRYFAVKKMQIATKEKPRTIREEHTLQELRAAVLKEVSMLRELGQHPNIIGFKDVVSSGSEIWIVLEWAKDGDLFEARRKYESGIMPDKRAAHVVLDVARGLIYMHSKNLIHRDIKLENILLDGERAMIADFGLSGFDNGTRKSMVGTQGYLAPEIMVMGRRLKRARQQRRGNATALHYDKRVDIYSLGVLLYDLLTGFLPEKSIPLHEQFPSSVNTDAKDLVLRMCRTEPDDRITLEEVLRHPFVAKNCSHIITQRHSLTLPMQTLAESEPNTALFDRILSACNNVEKSLSGKAPIQQIEEECEDKENQPPADVASNGKAASGKPSPLSLIHCNLVRKCPSPSQSRKRKMGVEVVSCEDPPSPSFSGVSPIDLVDSSAKRVKLQHSN